MTKICDVTSSNKKFPNLHRAFYIVYFVRIAYSDGDWRPAFELCCVQFRNRPRIKRFQLHRRTHFTICESI